MGAKGVDGRFKQIFFVWRMSFLPLLQDSQADTSEWPVDSALFFYNRLKQIASAELKPILKLMAALHGSPTWQP